MDRLRSIFLFFASVALLDLQSPSVTIATPMTGCLPFLSFFKPAGDLDSARAPLNKAKVEESSCLPLWSMFMPSEDLKPESTPIGFEDYSRREFQAKAIGNKIRAVISDLKAYPAAVGLPIRQQVFSGSFGPMYCAFEEYLPSCDQMIDTDQPVIKNLQNHLQYTAANDLFYFSFPVDGHKIVLQTRAKGPESLCEVRQVINRILKNWFVSHSDGRYTRNYVHHSNLLAQTIEVENFLSGIIETIYESKAAYNPFDTEWHELFLLHVHAIASKMFGSNATEKSRGWNLQLAIKKIVDWIKAEERKFASNT